MVKKFLPVLHIHHILNPTRTQQFVMKIESLSKMNNDGLALIVDIPNQMPVQVDKLQQALREVRSKFSYPIYGFTKSTCSPESYYLLSVADRIYTSETTMFTFRRQMRRFTFKNVSNWLGYTKSVISSRENLLGKYIDAFTAPESIKYGNHKETDINERLVKYSLINRSQILLSEGYPQRSKEVKDVSNLDSIMIGKEVVDKNLADGFGSYEEVLRQLHPDCHIMKVEYSNEQFAVGKIVAIVTSPFLVLLFLFKVVIKYSLIMYFYFKAKAKGQNKTYQEIQKEANDSY